MLIRRHFLGASTALALMPSVRALAAPGTTADGAVLVTVFLRGGMDSLGVVAPVDDPDYIACRPPELRLLADGDKPALRLEGGPAGLDFRLHPEMGALHALYQDRRVALVHASGLDNGTRSHFGAQELIERGIANPDESARVGGGWMARWLAATGGGRQPAFAAIAGAPDELANHVNTICAADLRGGMNLSGGKQALSVLRNLSSSDSSPIERATARMLEGIALIDGSLRQPDGKVLPYRPGGDAAYGDTEIGRGLEAIARVIRMEAGIRAFAVDMGGWDTHENQPGRLANLAGQLSRALGAFHADLQDRLDRVVLVVMSEFGRRPALQQEQRHGSWPCWPHDRLRAAHRRRAHPRRMARPVLRSAGQCRRSRHDGGCSRHPGGTHDRPARHARCRGQRVPAIVAEEDRAACLMRSRGPGRRTRAIRQGCARADRGRPCRGGRVRHDRCGEPLLALRPSGQRLRSITSRVPASLPAASLVPSGDQARPVMAEPSAIFSTTERRVLMSPSCSSPES